MNEGSEEQLLLPGVEPPPPKPAKRRAKKQTQAKPELVKEAHLALIETLHAREAQVSEFMGEVKRWRALHEAAQYRANRLTQATHKLHAAYVAWAESGEQTFTPEFLGVLVGLFSIVDIEESSDDAT